MTERSRDVADRLFAVLDAAAGIPEMGDAERELREAEPLGLSAGFTARLEEPGRPAPATRPRRRPGWQRWAAAVLALGLSIAAAKCAHDWSLRNSSDELTLKEALRASTDPTHSEGSRLAAFGAAFARLRVGVTAVKRRGGAAPPTKSVASTVLKSVRTLCEHPEAAKGARVDPAGYEDTLQTIERGDGAAVRAAMLEVTALIEHSIWVLYEARLQGPRFQRLFENQVWQTLRRVTE